MEGYATDILLESKNPLTAIPSFDIDIQDGGEIRPLSFRITSALVNEDSGASVELTGSVEFTSGGVVSKFSILTFLADDSDGVVAFCSDDLSLDALE